MAEVAVHREVKMLVIRLNGGDEVINLDLGIKLFLYLTLQGLFRSFTIFNLSSGEFPFILELAITALGRKDFPVSAPDDCCNNFYVFHNSILSAYCLLHGLVEYKDRHMVFHFPGN